MMKFGEIALQKSRWNESKSLRIPTSWKGVYLILDGDHHVEWGVGTAQSLSPQHGVHSSHRLRRRSVTMTCQSHDNHSDLGREQTWSFIVELHICKHWQPQRLKSKSTDEKSVSRSNDNSRGTYQFGFRSYFPRIPP